MPSRRFSFRSHGIPVMLIPRLSSSGHRRIVLGLWWRGAACITTSRATDGADSVPRCRCMGLAFCFPFSLCFGGRGVVTCGALYSSTMNSYIRAVCPVGCKFPFAPSLCGACCFSGVVLWVADVFGGVGAVLVDKLFVGGFSVWLLRHIDGGLVYGSLRESCCTRYRYPQTSSSRATP